MGSELTEENAEEYWHRFHRWLAVQAASVFCMGLFLSWNVLFVGSAERHFGPALFLALALVLQGAALVMFIRLTRFQKQVFTTEEVKALVRSWRPWTVPSLLFFELCGFAIAAGIYFNRFPFPELDVRAALYVALLGFGAGLFASSAATLIRGRPHERTA